MNDWRILYHRPTECQSVFQCSRGCEVCNKPADGSHLMDSIAGSSPSVLGQTVRAWCTVVYPILVATSYVPWTHYRLLGRS